MALTEALEILKDSLSCVTCNGAQHTHIQLEERDTSANLRRITLFAEGGDWFCFSPDEGSKCKRLDRKTRLVLMSPLLMVSGSHKHHCACDAVILVQRDDKLIALYIELKSSNNPAGYVNQFKSTRQFMRYALGLLEEFHGRRLKIFEERYIVFHGGKKAPSLNKKPTVPKTGKIGKTQPEQPFKRQVSDKDSLYLKELLA
jgi:hypothetical protein